MATTIREERRKRGILGWIFLLLFWGFNLLMALVLVAGLSAVGDVPSPTSEAEQAGQALGTAIGVGMILSIWMAGVVILGAMALLTRGRKIIVEREA